MCNCVSVTYFYVKKYTERHINTHGSHTYMSSVFAGPLLCGHNIGPKAFTLETFMFTVLTRNIRRHVALLSTSLQNEKRPMKFSLLYRGKKRATVTYSLPTRYTNISQEKFKKKSPLHGQLVQHFRK